jgi:TusA-related sulfurtransferase
MKTCFCAVAQSPSWIREPFTRILLLFFALHACSSATPVYTTGSYTRLPPHGMRIVVAANDPAVANTVRQWLEDRELVVVHADFESASEKSVLNHGAQLGAQQAVLVESNRTARPARMEITIKGLSIPDGRDMWSGRAWNALPADVFGEEAQRNAETLTCHALATIWRYRPAGIPVNPSNDPCYRQTD